MKLSFLILLSFIFLSTIHCGGGTATETTTPTTPLEDPTDESETVNTAKLAGTPFEGKETGDDFDWNFFLCNQYSTQTITELPIKIFAAYFTQAEEEEIQAGIDIANAAMEFTAYELTDAWNDQVRVIYKVDDIAREDGYDPNAGGHTQGSFFYFDGREVSKNIAMDWGVELTQGGTNQWTVAHELGHTSGIISHALIDYETDGISYDDLEEGSLMSSSFSFSDPAMTHYNYMMQMQGQIMKEHLSEIGDQLTNYCD